ncbi:MAG: hypothetical protein PWP27_859 [Clostridiales bacterium]|jgi:hypothetical protein|nr:hypothetical protein [Clostridiales bacterium]MDK2933049.1 hypothetical protein [Clostridiales bacterium]
MFESYFIQKTQVFIHKLLKWYKYSLMENFLLHISKYINKLWTNSVTRKYLTKNEQISSLWQNSLTFEFIQRLIAFIIHILKYTFDLVGRLNANSVSKKLYHEYVQPLVDISNTTTALSCVLTGFFIMNIIATWYANALTLHGLILRFMILIGVSLPIWIQKEQLSHSLKNSIFIKLFRWIFIN